MLCNDAKYSGVVIFVLSVNRSKISHPGDAAPTTDHAKYQNIFLYFLNIVK